MFNSLANAAQSFSLFIESYALFKSTNTIPSAFLVLTLCCTIVYMMRACSVVVWWARKPACGGACRLPLLAVSVRRWLTSAIRTFAKGGVIAILL